jgi:hypothetical protein
VVAFGECPARIVPERRIPFERPLELKQRDAHCRLGKEVWRVLPREGTFHAG